MYKRQLIGKTRVEEEKCISDYNQSFIISYDDHWEIPAIDENFRFSVFNQNGKIYYHEYEIGDEIVWDGISNNGVQANLGYYRFEIIYSDGKKCYGELTIGN